MTVRTHLSIDQGLCGTPRELGDGTATVEMVARADMAADDRGLVHGGFVFGQADYAAMLAVNDPNVVLGSADTRFIRPVTVGQRVVCDATVEETKGKKRIVRVRARVDSDTVLEGTMTCFVLDHHVLDREK